MKWIRKAIGIINPFRRGKKPGPEVSKSIPKPMRVQPLERSGSIYYKEKVDPKHYGFSTAPEWRYFDGFVSKNPHLVLKDHNGKPRFTLQYSEAEGIIRVESIQREQTISGLPPEVAHMAGQLETIQSEEFERKLGMHPAEFLLSEFLHQNAAKIRQGTQVMLVQRLTAKTSPIYRGLIDRFCESQRSGEGFFISRKKDRPKKLLGL